jgi:hypothetical protein
VPHRPERQNAKKQPNTHSSCRSCCRCSLPRQADCSTTAELISTSRQASASLLCGWERFQLREVKVVLCSPGLAGAQRGPQRKTQQRLFSPALARPRLSTLHTPAHIVELVHNRIYAR